MCTQAFANSVIEDDLPSFCPNYYAVKKFVISPRKTILTGYSSVCEPVMCIINTKKNLYIELNEEALHVLEHKREALIPKLNCSNIRFVAQLNSSTNLKIFNRSSRKKIFLQEEEKIFLFSPQELHALLNVQMIREMTLYLRYLKMKRNEVIRYVKRYKLACEEIKVKKLSEKNLYLVPENPLQDFYPDYDTNILIYKNPLDGDASLIREICSNKVAFIKVDRKKMK